MDLFTEAFRELREGIAKEGGVIAKKGSEEKAAPAKGGGDKPDAKKGGDKEKGKDTSDESRVKQAVYDIRYRAKRENIPVAQAMTDYLKHSGSLGPKARAELKKKLIGEAATPESGTGKYYDEKNPTPQQLANRKKREQIKDLTNKGKHKEASALHNEAQGCDSKKVKKEELEVTESADTQKKGPSGDTLYKVRVKNTDGRTEIRYASRAKISQLRANNNITSVEITGHGEPYNKNAGAGEDAKKENEKNAKARKDHDGDGKVESGSKEHAGAVHNAIQKKKGGKQDGQDTRKESFSDWRTDLGYVSEHHQKDVDGNVVEHDGEEVDEARRADKMGIPRKKVTYDKGSETRNPNPDRGATSLHKPAGSSLAGSKAASRARSLGDKRRAANRKGANLAYGDREGRLADFANTKRQSDSDLGSQKAATDTGAHKNKQGFRQNHKYGERGDKRRPQQNPKHTANTKKEEFEVKK